MVYLYGVGEKCIKLLEEKKFSFEYVLVDGKKGGCVQNHKVYAKEKLGEVSQDDEVYIVSTKYYLEIKDELLKEYPHICCKTYVQLLIKIYKLEVERSKEYAYNTIPLDKWLMTANIDELAYWDGNVPKRIEKGDERLMKRNLCYQYNPEIEFKVTDVIVDAGAGPLPKFGNLVNGEEVRYIPVDPLAYEYSKLLTKYNIDLPVKTEFALFEALTVFFKEDSVDYVIVNNALDHCMDILRALIECYRILKVNGTLLLAHLECEGVGENYVGMHQWNIMELGGDLLFGDNQNNCINVTELLRGYAEIEIKRQQSDDEDDIDRDLLVCKITKRKNLCKEIIDLYDDALFIGNWIKQIVKQNI